MNNVVSVDFKEKKSKKQQAEYKAEIDKKNADFNERVDRIRSSISRISEIMAELRSTK